MSSLLTSLAAHVVGSQSIFQTYDARAVSGSDATITASRLQFARMPRVTSPTAWAYATIYVATAAGNVDIAIVRGDPATSGTRVGSTGSTAAAGTGAVQRIAFTAPVVQQPSADYWLAVGGDNASLSLRGNAVNAVQGAAASLHVHISSGWSSGIPASVSGAVGTARVIWVLLEAS